jgi:hypothetical protein
MPIPLLPVTPARPLTPYQRGRLVDRWLDYRDEAIVALKVAAGCSTGWRDELRNRVALADAELARLGVTN